MRRSFWVFRILAVLCMATFATPTYAQEDADLSAEEKAKAEAAEARKKAKMARVIVLEWDDSEANYENETLMRNVRSRIGRSDALFFPEVDLYQNGRKVKDRTVIPAQQPALVPSTNIPEVMAAVQEVASLRDNKLQPHEWALKARDLQKYVEKLWFVDRAELREPLFLLYSQLGRAATNSLNPAPPFFESIGGVTVNYYHYLAAILAQTDPELMTGLTDENVKMGIQYWLTELQRGGFPTIKVDLELSGEEDVATTYEILFNGLAVEADENEQVPVFLGRTDIYLKRLDGGSGLSERLEVVKLDEKAYPVMQNARKTMGIDFIDQLFLHPNECSPDLDGDILNFLSIYQKLHDAAEVYVAVAEDGNPNKTWIWRYDRRSATLSNIGGGGDTFPVRFAFVFNVGGLNNGVDVSTIDAASVPDLAQSGDTPDVTDLVSMEPSGFAVPLNPEIRGHWNRLMVAFGAEFSMGTWSDNYRLPGAGENAYGQAGGSLQLHEPGLNRYLYGSVGVLLGANAGIGFGPRFALRAGGTNTPVATQVEGHFGWTLQAPIGESSGRVRPLIDTDFRAGAVIPTANSLYTDVMPIFGGTVGVGLTF